MTSSIFVSGMQRTASDFCLLGNDDRMRRDTQTIFGPDTECGRLNTLHSLSISGVDAVSVAAYDVLWWIMTTGGIECAACCA